MYDELYKVWKWEKENIEIQSLPRDFYIKLTVYLKKIREGSRMLDENTAKGRLLKRELKNVEKMVKELVKLRCKKALEKIMSEEILPQENITEEEEKLFNEFLSLAASYQDFLTGILRGRLSRIERKAPKQSLVRFLQSVPEIIGSDMKTYGPFNAEEIAILPPENARILIKQGVAVEIEEDESSQEH